MLFVCVCHLRNLAGSICLELIQSIQTAESCFIRHVSVLMTLLLSWQETSLLKIGQESFVPALKRCSPEGGKEKNVSRGKASSPAAYL